MFVPSPPSTQELFERFADDRAALERIARHRTTNEQPLRGYPHWSKVMRLDPPPGLTLEEWWLAVKLGRRQASRPLPLTDADGRRFTVSFPDETMRALHFIDQRAGGRIAMRDMVVGQAQAERHFLIESLMEESIRSSQLEGAATTRRVAREMLRTGRPARDRGERMVLNNYHAMRFIRDEIGEELRPADVLALHGIVTAGTLDNPKAAGRLQLPGEPRVAVVDPVTGQALHRPPPASQLPERLDAMCRFANEADTGEEFIHPVARAVLLHLWLAYDHPFDDGNGRTARALFYWFMRRHGYWLAEYLSISRILRNAPAKYARAFLYVETDELDATYFLLHQLRTIVTAIHELDAYLARKVGEIRSVESLLRQSTRFNHRQLALLGNALRNEDATYTIVSHAGSHGVTHETARNDLNALASLGLLGRQRQGRTIVFSPATDLATVLKETG